MPIPRLFVLATFASGIIGLPAVGAAGSSAVETDTTELEAASTTEPAVTVEVVERESGYVLLRDGEPYFVRGVGGTRSLDRLAELGGNSIRTWGHEELNERTWPIDATRS